MRFLASLVLGLIAFTSGGCVMHSINPIYTPETTVTDDAFLGTWNVAKADDQPFQSMEVTTRDASSYSVVLTFAEKDQPAVSLRLIGRLVQLGDHRFIDLETDPQERSQCLDKHAGFMVPVHLFALIKLDAGSLKLGALSEDWLVAHLKQSPGTVQYCERDNGDVLLTSGTAELHSFLKTAADDPKAFSETDDPLVKAPKPPAP